MIEKIKQWYEGEYVPHMNDSDSAIFRLGGSHKRHWTAKLIRWAVEFYMREWKWTLGALAAVIGALVLKR
jgi:hypothetical protein